VLEEKESDIMESIEIFVVKKKKRQEKYLQRETNKDER